MNNVSPDPDVIAALRARIATVDGNVARAAALPFRIEEVDRRLAGRGLGGAALHEVAPAAPAWADEAAATLFVAGACARFGAGRAPVVWVVTRFDLYAPGLEQSGLRPDRVMFVHARDDSETLAVMEDALRHGGLGAVVGEVRRVDLTPTRRLQLAAAEGGTPAFLLRRWRKAGACPLADASTASTRWRIGSAPSAPLGLPGVGRAQWSVELARQRNGDPFKLILEGCDAEGRLALPGAIADRAVALDRASARVAA